MPVTTAVPVVLAQTQAPPAPAVEGAQLILAALEPAAGPDDQQDPGDPRQSAAGPETVISVVGLLVILLISAFV
jgi:hypothetical protein